ncbi:MAG: hypothetical protein ABI855_13915 [Bacteroidota bacterium]
METSQSLLWNSFSSFFQLGAAFCLTYAFIEPFTANFNKKIYELADFFSSAEYLDEKQRKQTENYYKFLQNRIVSLPDLQILDPLCGDVKLIIDKYKIVFFNGFLSCVLFLIFAAFESFYQGHPNINEKFCGLIIIPFISQIFLLLLLEPLKKESQIQNDLSRWKEIKKEKESNYFLPLKLLLICFGMGGLIIYIFLRHKAQVISIDGIKWMVFYCMISTILPFITQYIEINRMVKRYDRAAKKLI